MKKMYVKPVVMKRESLQSVTAASEPVVSGATI